MTTVLAAALLASVRADDVTGTVTLANGKPAKNAVVWLDGEKKGKPLKNVVIDQRDRVFLPHITAVTVGTTVDFPNNDTVFHNVFTEYHSQRFDFGMYARGRTKRWTFDREGLAVLLCGIHPHMSAYVMCVDTPYFAVTDGKGKFSIKDVDRGTYTVRAWHENGQKSSNTQTVAPGDVLNLQTK